MREQVFIQGLQVAGDQIKRMKARNQELDQQFITLRLQMNAIVGIVRWLFPLNLIFKYLVNKEFNAYTKQLDERKKQFEEMKKKFEETKKQPVIKNPKLKVGRNHKCHCGSEKKYKKCCMESDLGLERAKDPADAKREANPSKCDIADEKADIDAFQKKNGAVSGDPSGKGLV